MKRIKKIFSAARAILIDILMAAGSATLATAILAVFFVATVGVEKMEEELLPIMALFAIIWATATLAAWLREYFPMAPRYIVLNADVTVERDAGVSIRYSTTDDHKVFVAKKEKSDA